MKLTPLQTIEDLIKTQRSACDCVNDHYYRGLLNGLILAKACLDGITPVFQECPPHLKQIPEYVNHGDPEPAE